MFNCTHIHVHRKSMLFLYTWPPQLASSATNLTRSFRIKFSNDKDFDECIKLLEDYFSINVYSSTDINVCIKLTQPTKLNSLFFNETKNVLSLEQSTTMNIRTNFIRQYLSTCIIDPAFFIFVSQNEDYLKKILAEK